MRHLDYNRRHILTVDAGISTGLALTTLENGNFHIIKTFTFSFPGMDAQTTGKNIAAWAERTSLVIVEWPVLKDGYMYNNYLTSLKEYALQYLREQQVSREPDQPLEIRSVRPTDWKQTPAKKEVFKLWHHATKHEQDATRIAYWYWTFNHKDEDIVNGHS